MMREEHGAHALVVECVAAGGDEEGLGDSHGEETDAAVGCYGGCVGGGSGSAGGVCVGVLGLRVRRW